MKIDVHVGPITVTLIDGAVSGKLDVILEKLNTILTKEIAIMAELDDLTAAVARETTVEESATVLIRQIAAKLNQIVQNATELAAAKAAMAAAASQINANVDKLAEAVTTNTPAS